MTTTYQSLFFAYGSQFGADGNVDLTTNETGLTRSACFPGGDSWQVSWPNAGPVAIVYFVNRGTANGPNNIAITNGSGTLAVLNQQGGVVASATLTSATVTTVAAGVYGSAGVAANGLAAPVRAPVFPSPSDPWQASFVGQTLGVRYINITCPNILNFREVFIFDNTMTNVACA